MKVAAVNCVKTNFKRQESYPVNSAFYKETNSNKNYDLMHIPYFAPVVSFSRRVSNQLEVNFEEKPFQILSIDIPRDVIKEGFEFYGSVNLQNIYEEPQEGYAFIKTHKNTENADCNVVQIRIKNKYFDDIGDLYAALRRDEDNKPFAHCALNNYANIYADNDLEDSKMQYKRVGTELYRVLEEYLKENNPEVEYLEACPINQGSKIFHRKMGFKYDKYDYNKGVTKYNGSAETNGYSLLCCIKPIK